MQATLILEDGTHFEGKNFGAVKNTAGEVVFSTGMVGYPEGITDPSFEGQILIFTYPIIGSYGVPDKKFWESDRIHTSAVIVSDYIDTPSHFGSVGTLSSWLKKENVPGLVIKDTRFLTQKIREKGTMLGRIIFTPIKPRLNRGRSGSAKDEDERFYDPNLENLVAKVSTKKVITRGSGKKTVLLIDCGAKRNIAANLANRGIKVIIVPWDFDPFESALKFDAVVISNGPGDPKKADKTIRIIEKTIEQKIPILGICLGNQLLALAAGGDTEKLKFGHRSQNQPCKLVGSERCYITTQNHGFAVSLVPEGFKPWFINANDNSNEGIIHESLPFMSVQFHPEAQPGPTDTEWIFDYFLEKIE